MSDIKFGTDGWRGRIADDYTYANVRRAAQAFATYLLNSNKESNGPKSVVVGYDKRFSAEHFAATAAEVLAGNPARSAVNIPSMRPEHIEPVRPFLGIAEKLGLLLGQLIEGPIRRLEVLYAGELAEKRTDPLTTAVLKGLLSGAVAEGVNYVNAPLVAKERGIEVRESRTTEAGEFHDLIEVSCEAGDSRKTVAGTVFGDGNPRIVRIGDLRFNMEPEGYILIAPHEDTPGVVGRIGTLLGQNNINIFGLQLGRRFRRGPAVMALNVDEPIPPELLATIGSLEGFHDVRCVKL